MSSGSIWTISKTLSQQEIEKKKAVDGQYRAQGQPQHGANVPTQKAELKEQGASQTAGRSTGEDHLEGAVTCRANPQ